MFLVIYCCFQKCIEKNLVNYSYFGSCPRSGGFTKGVDIKGHLWMLCSTSFYNFKIVNLVGTTALRATSHARLRARDHYTSSTLTGGKGGGASPSSLHNTLEGPMEYVNARWM